MRNGFRAFDADTHVNPAANVLDRYVDPSFRPRLADLAPHRVASGTMIGGTPDTDQYRVATKFYRRVLGEAGAHETFTGRGTHWMGTKQPRVGCRTIRPKTASRTWTTKGPMRISWCRHSGSASSVSRTSSSRSA